MKFDLLLIEKCRILQVGKSPKSKGIKNGSSNDNGYSKPHQVNRK